MEFNPGKKQLQDTAGHRLTPEVVVGGRLIDEQKMLDVMPELDHERHRPPGSSSSCKAFAQYPYPDEHHHGVAIVQRLRLDEPRIPQTDQAIGLRSRPSHDINLVSLEQMLSPMRQDNKQEDLQRALVPLGIELLVKAGVCRRSHVNARNCGIGNRHARASSFQNLLEQLKAKQKWINNRILLGQFRSRKPLKRGEI